MHSIRNIALVTILIGAQQLPAAPQSHVRAPRDIFEGLSLADHRALNYPGDPRCWNGLGYTWDYCCTGNTYTDEHGKSIDIGCFDDVFFSYELCCFPVKPEDHTGFSYSRSNELGTSIRGNITNDIVDYWLADVFKMEIPPPTSDRNNDDDHGKDKCDAAVEAMASGSTDRAGSTRLPAFDFASRPKNFYSGSYADFRYAETSWIPSKRVNDTSKLSDGDFFVSYDTEDVCLYAWKKVKSLGCG